MKKLLLATGFWLLAVFSFAQDNCIPAKPVPVHFVNNFSKEFPDFLSLEEQQTLEDKLQAFNKETSNQIVIVIVDDLCGYDANEFSTRLGQTWGVGQGKFDNGVVLMVKPSGGAGNRATYIAVGYGLEGIIPDITSKQIVDHEINPQFKNGSYYGGLNSGTDVLISLAKKEFSYTDYQKTNKQENWHPFQIFVVLFILFVILSARKRRYTTIGGSGTYYGGGWSGWSGGGSSGGGGSSFGGGGFGGGGSGGSW